MAYVGNILIEPSISEIKTALSASENNIGALCTHENINMWARYKPIRYPKMFEITANERVRAGFGLKPFMMQNATFGEFGSEVLRQMQTDGFVKRLGMTYVKPDGSDMGMYRRKDFDKYKHDATLLLSVPVTTASGAQEWLSIASTTSGDIIDASSGRKTKIEDPEFEKLGTLNRESGEMVYNANIFDVMASAMNVEVRDLSGMHHYVLLANPYYMQATLCEGEIDWDKVLVNFDMPGARTVELPVVDFWTTSVLTSQTTRTNFFAYFMGMQKVRTDFIVTITYNLVPEGQRDGGEFMVTVDGVTFGELWHPVVWLSFYKNGVHDIVPLGTAWTPAGRGGISLEGVSGNRFEYAFGSQIFDNYEGVPYVHFCCFKSNEQSIGNIRKIVEEEGFRPNY